jgi:nicotinamidase-related amidase
MLLKADQSCVLLVDVQEKLIPTIYEYQRLIANCQWLLSIAHELRIIRAASEQYPKGLGGTVAVLKEFVPNSHVMTKTTFSCAADPACLESICALNKDHVVIAGIEAHVCVLQTAIGLTENGKKVFVVADAVSSRNPNDKELALARMRQSGIEIVSKEMVLFEWLGSSTHPRFKELSKKFLR